ncbi:MAG TPA: hypothetical protein VH092_03180, partial [Urbifossiella sp.]|nr:hypothetical protein [Urbifossiella sp.]
GFINMGANSAGAVGSPVIGALRDDAGLGDRGCLLLLAASFALGAVFVAAISVRPAYPSVDPARSAEEP